MSRESLGLGNNVLIRIGGAPGIGWSNMLYSGFNTLPRSVIRRQTGFAARITQALSRLNNAMQTLNNETVIKLIDRISKRNPYEPPSTSSPTLEMSPSETSFVVPPRICLLTFAALVVSLFSAIAICVYHHYGIGGIGDPILASLASKSILWIPIYRMASVSLVLIMPKACRSTYGILFLIIGLACCINDYALIFAGRSVITETLGLYPAFAICIAISTIAFVDNLIRSRKRMLLVTQSFGWLAVILVVHTIFYLLTLVI